MSTKKNIPGPKTASLESRALEGFSPATREWFAAAFPAPTGVQDAAWAAIRSGSNALVIAPTGSGKTLSAFMHAIDRLFQEKAEAPRPAKKKALKTAIKVLYISPLKALGADVRRNLGIPLDGVAAARERRGDPPVEISVGMRTGDTPSRERAALLRQPPDILITTPESLYLMLTSKARETLREVRTVIIDEVHAVAGTKRGSHLALSLERLDELLTQPAQRVGLSATVRPVERVAGFLGGARPVTVINPPSERRLEMRIVVPVEDMKDLSVPSGPKDGGAPELTKRGGSIWFHVESSVLERVMACRSTIVFVNSRGLAERMTARLNELYAEKFASQLEAPPEVNGAVEQYLSTNGGTVNRSGGYPPLIARSHHGSVSKERRAEIEEALKTGELRCVVATSSLELGIDMGQVDQVIQVAPPPSVSAGLQRVGRAGHHVGGTPSGVVYPRTRRDLVDATVAVEKMLAGQIEAINPPRNPLDVLAQQTVAQVAMQPVQVDEWYSAVRRSEPFRSLPRSAYDATLDMLAGRFPSDEFAEFRPRLVWDRVSGTLTARPGAQRLAVINGGTIPDRGTYSVVLPEGEEQSGARRVGELDEEMVYESRVNDVITLGASSWRIQQITNDQVVVTPAPGRSARLPFWHGDGPGRPAELGESIGAFLRRVDVGAPPSQGCPEPGEQAEALSRDERALEESLAAAGLESNGIRNLLDFVGEQRGATGALPTDQTLVIERCRDELGDWRVMLHSPYGRRVHAPWALAVGERIRQCFKVDAALVASDDGIVARIPDTEGRLPGAELFIFEAEAMQRFITEAVGGTALFAARFRECASRALLLPRRTPGRRSPLWQQRLRAGQLLEVAREHPDFPILLETARECLQDVYDLPALQGLMERIAAGRVRFAEVTTETPSPFAANLLFGYVGEFMYDDDIPLAERRASLLALDSSLLGELLGNTDLGELLDPQVTRQLEAELQRLAPDRRAAGMEGIADLLRELGPLSADEAAERLRPDDVAAAPEAALAEALRHLEHLENSGRAIKVNVGGEARWAAVEDAARLRDVLGVILPGGIPGVFLEPVADPLRDLAARYARTHGPFTTGSAAARLGIGVAVLHEALERLREQGRLLRGEFGAAELAAVLTGERLENSADEPISNPLAQHEWVWEDVFRRLRLRSLQAAREATRPVDKPAFVRQLLERQYVIPEIIPFGGAKVAAQPPVMPNGPALHGLDGVARVIEQLSGLALPASLWESQIFPARVRDYSQGMLDELIATGEVIWTGGGRLGDNDGLVALHLRELAAETLPALAELAPEADMGEGQKAILEVLSGGGAFFAVQIAEIVRANMTSRQQNPGAENIFANESDLHDALWALAWSGRVTTDTWSPLRALGTKAGAARPARKTRSVRRRINGAYRTQTFTSKLEPQLGSSPSLSGRWSPVPRPDVPETARALALAEGLLDRYGVVTRGAAMTEGVPGGFPTLQRIFRGMEDAGRLLRGRFVQGLGAAQFADNATIDRLRELADSSVPAGPAVALSAADPANPFGVILPWPSHHTPYRPTRHAGAYVAIRDGQLVLWLAQGGRRLLSFVRATDSETEETLRVAAAALANALQRSGSSSFTLETVDERPVESTPLGEILRSAGFSRTHKGLSWYWRPGR